MSAGETLVLRLLEEHRHGLYGSELVHLSGGKLRRGTIYSLLERMVAAGLVQEIEDPPSDELQLARTRHRLTEHGRRVLRDSEAAHLGTIDAGALRPA